jgi:hypothetical protein
MSRHGATLWTVSRTGEHAYRTTGATSATILVPDPPRCSSSGEGERGAPSLECVPRAGWRDHFQAARLAQGFEPLVHEHDLRVEDVH